MKLTTVKLKRIFVVFNWDYWKLRWTGLLFVPIAFIVSILLRRATNNNTVGYCVFLFMIAVLAYGYIIELLDKPKEFSYTETSITFHDILPHMNDAQTGFKLIKFRYRVTNISNVRFAQNRFEKLFDVGHIYFSGISDHPVGFHSEAYIPVKKFALYGIPEFSKFIEEFPHKNK